VQQQADESWLLEDVATCTGMGRSAWQRTAQYSEKWNRLPVRCQELGKMMLKCRVRTARSRRRAKEEETQTTREEQDGTGRLCTEGARTKRKEEEEEANREKEKCWPDPPTMNLGAGYNEPPKDEPEGVHPRGQHSRNLDVGGQGHCYDAPWGEEEQVQEDKEEVPEELGCMRKITGQNLPCETAVMGTERWHSKLLNHRPHNVRWRAAGILETSQDILISQAVDDFDANCMEQLLVLTFSSTANSESCRLWQRNSSGLANARQVGRHSGA